MNSIINLINKIIAFYRVRKYDEYLITEYFREQGAQIGNDCYFGITYLSSEPYLIKIGNHVQVANGVKFITHNPGWCHRHVLPDLQAFGTICIEDNSYIGENSILLPNVTVGVNCVVAAGSVVTKDVPPNSIVGGNPAKVIGNTDDYFLKVKEIWRQQKPPEYLSELREGQYYAPNYFASIRGKKENREMLKKHLTNLFWNQ